MWSKPDVIHDLFSGGMELLFDNVREHKIELPTQASDNHPTILQDLIIYIRDNMMTERKELFVVKGTV
jgi:ubiquitin related modifier 1